MEIRMARPMMVREEQKMMNGERRLGRWEATGIMRAKANAAAIGGTVWSWVWTVV